MPSGFILASRNNGPGVRYIQSAKWDGRHEPLLACYKEIVAGGTLELQLGSAPNLNWDIEPVTNAPA